MVDALPPIEGSPAASAVRSVRSNGTPKLFAVASPAEDQLPPLPPAEVLDALDTAARVLDQLDRKQIKLWVDHDPKTNQIRAHVRDGVTGTEREIPSSRLLNILAGDLRGLAVDTKG
jgi:hypothetical protein